MSAADIMPFTVVRAGMSPLLTASLEQPPEPTDYERTEQLFNAAWRLLEATGREMTVNGEAALVTPEPVIIPMGNGDPLYARLAAKQFTSSARQGIFRRLKTVHAYGNPSVIYSRSEKPVEQEITTIEQYFSRLAIRFVRVTGNCYLTTGDGFHCEINNSADITFTREVLGKLAYANGYSKQAPAELLPKPSASAVPEVISARRMQKHEQLQYYRAMRAYTAELNRPRKHKYPSKYRIEQEWIPNEKLFAKLAFAAIYESKKRKYNNHYDFDNQYPDR